MNKEVAVIPADYADWLIAIKTRVTAARQRAALAANAELIALYWQIGDDLLQRQQSANWGDKVLDRLASDLREAFPEMKGFSSRNLKYMRYFAEHCPRQAFGQQAAAQLPWFHVVTLLTKLADNGAREWYAQRAIAEGWSRTSLELNIRNRLHERQGQALTNFGARLPAPHSELAHETLKDPYLFDFLGLGDEAHEREIENALVRGTSPNSCWSWAAALPSWGVSAGWKSKAMSSSSICSSITRGSSATWWWS
jgi:predicted nuclease of restriction endonuclease-like (RecB) superfamily